MMHNFDYMGYCVGCDEHAGLNTQHLCPACFTSSQHFANDNREDVTKDMSPWGAALFNALRPVDLKERNKSLEHLMSEINKRIGNEQ